MKWSAFPSFLLMGTVVLVQWFMPQQAAAQSRSKEKMKVREEVNMQREKRKGIRESRQYESSFKSTHLNTRSYKYREGDAGRKSAAPEDKPRLNRAMKIKKGLKSRLSFLSRTR